MSERVNKKHTIRKYIGIGGVLFMAGFCYSENTSAQVTVKENEQIEMDVTSPSSIYAPVYYVENGEQKCYEGVCIYEVKWNDIQNDLNAYMPGILVDGITMLPVQAVVGTEKMGGSLTVSGAGIVVERSGRTISYEIGSTQAYLNGELVAIERAPMHVKYNGCEYDLVPAQTLFQFLGAEDIVVEEEYNRIVAKKETGTFLQWNLASLPEKNNEVQSVRVANAGTKEKITVTCKNTSKVSVSSNKETIKVTLRNTYIDYERLEDIYDSKYTKQIGIVQEENRTILTIKKKSGINFMYQYGNGKVYLYLNATPVRIAVDCGHGAYTPGKRTPKLPWGLDFNGDGKINLRKGNSMREHQANVGVGKYLAKELERLGFKVYRSAFGKTDISLSGRQKNIKKFGAKYSISVHFNAVGSGRTFNSANGVEVFYHSQYGKGSSTLARNMVREMAKGTKQTNRGAKGARLAMCNTSAMGTTASVLVECAFMTNKREVKTMMGKERFWKETAEEIAKTMCQQAKVPYLEK